MTEQADRDAAALDRIADLGDELDDYEAREQHLAAEQRREFTERMAETGRGLERAGAEIAELKAAADDVARRMEALDNLMQQNVSTRRLTLNQVWWRLTDAGHLEAANLVGRMIDTADMLTDIDGKGAEAGEGK
ncbi:hypothetical protein SEA_MISCHIEF19_43 [Streptomyces phage Mischief19]|nr:hypothetical protein SEA_MISCHIEF19_43 [Streptomyces phage Mischief19]